MRQEQQAAVDATFAPFQQALTQGWEKALESFQALGKTPQADMPWEMPRFSFSAPRLQELQRQYVEEATELWRQDMAARARGDRRFAAEAWGSNPVAAFSAAVEMLRRHPFFRVKLEIDGEARVYKTPFVFLGNNEYSMDLYKIGSRERLDAGKLSVYFLRRGGRWGVICLILRTLVGTLDSMKEFEQLTTDSLTIDMRRDRVMVAFDGEVAVMETPLEYRIRPRALQVIVPHGVPE